MIWGGLNQGKFREDLPQKLRHSVLLIFSIKAGYKLLSVSLLFLPVASKFAPVPGIIFLGEGISIIWLVLTSLLVYSLVLEEVQSSSKWEHLFVVFVLMMGIALYRANLITPPTFMLLSILQVVAYSIILWGIFGYASKDSFARASRYTSYSLVFAMAWWLLASFVFIPELLLALVGLYLLLKLILGKLERTPEIVGMADRLYAATIRVAQESAGTIVICIAYMTLFSTTILYSASIIPFIFDSSNSFSTTYNFSVNYAWIVSFPFYSLIILFWFRLLDRAPHSVTFWEHGFQKDEHARLPPRPGYLTIALPTFGWVLSRLPTWFLNKAPVLLLTTDRVILAGYVGLLSVVLLWSVFLWTPVSRYLPDLPLDKSVKTDWKLYALAVCCLALMHAPIDGRSFLFISIAGVLLIFESTIDIASGHLIAINVIIFCIGFLLGLGTEFQTSGGKFWVILMVFILAHIWLQVSELFEPTN